MKCKEIPLLFTCHKQSLIGVLHKPKNCQSNLPGVLIVVGGPQYRVGSHRQFVLLARYLCEQGIAVLRFDHRGIGDSNGERHNFNHINADIKSALTEFNKQLPDVEKFVIWGLCDAASAAVFYAYTDSRIQGLVILNPWVHTAAGEAKAYLKGYYGKRLLSRELWKKILRGKFKPLSSLSSLVEIIKKSKVESNPPQGQQNNSATNVNLNNLPEAMAVCLQRFNGHVLIILSGNNDYVADEFKALIRKSKQWQSIMSRPGIVLQNINAANHTFAAKDWRKLVETRTCEWIKKL